ncbi:MAG: V-type ATPase subunit, partial [Candidatus Heimdallarchaeota archaeon]
MIKKVSSIFPYLKTKAHALLSYSPTEQQIKAMETARNLDELRSILTSTFAGSSAKLLVEKKNPILQFESQLRLEFSEMLKKMVNISSGSMYSTLEAFEFKITGYNLKTIFKTIILKQDREKMNASLIPTSHHSKDRLKEIIEFERPDILLDYIPNVELKHALTSVVNETVSNNEKIFKINNVIDQ